MLVELPLALFVTLPVCYTACPRKLRLLVAPCHAICLLLPRYVYFYCEASLQEKIRLACETILGHEHYKLIDDALSENDEQTSRLLSQLLIDKLPELSMSLSTMEHARRKLGWVDTVPKYCQLIRIANKEKRKKWCVRMLKTEED